MKIINLIIETLFAPFILLFRANAKTNISKKVKPFFVLIIALIIVAALVFLFYFEEIIK